MDRILLSTHLTLIDTRVRLSERDDILKDFEKRGLRIFQTYISNSDAPKKAEIFVGIRETYILDIIKEF